MAETEKVLWKVERSGNCGSVGVVVGWNGVLVALEGWGGAKGAGLKNFLNHKSEYL